MLPKRIHSQWWVCDSDHNAINDNNMNIDKIDPLKPSASLRPTDSFLISLSDHCRDENYVTEFFAPEPWVENEGACFGGTAICIQKIMFCCRSNLDRPEKCANSPDGGNCWTIMDC